MPIYLVDVELSGRIAVNAADVGEARDIADSIGLEDLKDFLLETKSRVQEILDDLAVENQRVFSVSDV